MNPQDTPSTQDPRQPASQPSAEEARSQAAQLPAEQATGSTPQMVYVSRPHEPAPMEISPQIQAKHDASVAKYPALNLSKGEFIISAVRRHPIGLLQIWAVVGIMLAIFLGIFAFVAYGASRTAGDSSSIPIEIVAIPVLLLSTLVVLFGIIQSIIYNGNEFFLTNESVIQHIQTSLFSRREQTVSLSNIEDASYTQHGLVQSVLNYGMIRLSTEGDETTYRFDYASEPKKQIAILNNAVEDFKNGRPVQAD